MANDLLLGVLNISPSIPFYNLRDEKFRSKIDENLPFY